MKLDLVRDPDALDNVCHTGAPLWLNQYYARWQEEVFRNLLGRVELEPGSRALDVGCGAGRWCRVFSEHGLEVTGIDLQQELIALNRERYPEMTFECGAIQEFEPAEPFSIISSVTVIAHNPFEEQPRVAAKLREITRTGGHVMLLENVRDQATHVFSNSEKGWIELFESNGFRFSALRRYDYSPLTRVVASIRGLSARGSASNNRDEADAVDGAANNGRRVSTVAGVLHRLAVSGDDRLEAALTRRQPRWPSVHCGFLFRAV